MFEKNYRFITLFTALFVSVLLISNIVSTKIVHLGWFEFDGGTLLFPLSYILGDVLTEVYGYSQSRRIIWIGFGMLALLWVSVWWVGMLPASPAWEYQTDYEHILGFTPRIIIASLGAYLVGEFFNSYILAKLKILTKGKKLWLRTISSTLVGEWFDSILFVGIAFYGVFANEILIGIILSNYVFKVWVEVLFTPLTYWVIDKVKTSEKEDYYDNKTNFSPFHS